MKRTVWINGRVVEPGEAAVSAFDAGFQHGVGLFETMLAQATDAAPAGRVFRLAEHMARLEGSAKALGLVSTLNTRALGEAVEGAVETSGICQAGDAQGTRARVRLTLTGGDLNMLAAARSGGAGGAGADPTVLIDVTPAQRYPSEMFERGVSLTVASAKANPLNEADGHKTLNYWWRLRELQSAAQRGAGEALVLMVTNHVCGGAVSNLIAVKHASDSADGGGANSAGHATGGELVTPIARGEESGGALPSPVLPGITRGAVLEFARDAGLNVTKRMLSIDDVLDADEVLLTNSSWGVLPVVRVEAKEIGDAAPGPVGRLLREKWEAAMGGEV